jgi:hypothetical protein
LINDAIFAEIFFDLALEMRQAAERSFNSWGLQQLWLEAAAEAATLTEAAISSCMRQE